MLNWKQMVEEMHRFNQYDHREQKRRNFHARHDGRITEEHISTFMEACAYVDAPPVIVLTREGLSSTELEDYLRELERLTRKYGFETDIDDQTHDGIVEILKWFQDGYNEGALDAPGWY